MNRLWLLIKERTYAAGVTALALVLLVACASLALKHDDSSISRYLLAAEQEKALPVSLETANLEQQIISEAPAKDAPPVNLRHADCIMDLVNMTEPSSVYVPNSKYDLSFVNPANSSSAGLNGFYDINGDSLPDYIYTYSYTGTVFEGNLRVAMSLHRSCVYLNNGQGWTKAYRCMAYTKVNADTGEFVLGEYRGDCAGS